MSQNQMQVLIEIVMILFYFFKKKRMVEPESTSKMAAFSIQIVQKIINISTDKFDIIYRTGHIMVNFTDKMSVDNRHAIFK